MTRRTARTRRTLGALGAHDVRRILAAVLLGALALGLSASAQTVSDAHAATSCTKHVKRDVKHVKRHGKRKKVVLLRPYWSCHEVAEPVVATPATPSAPAPAPTPVPTPEPEANAIGVVARDANKHFSFEPTRTVVKAGTLTMQLINEGEDPHTMAIQRIGPGGTPEGKETVIPETASKGQNLETVEVQPGHYRMWCTLYHHAEEGMEFELTVE
jgi:plastocyanin